MSTTKKTRTATARNAAKPKEKTLDEIILDHWEKRSGTRLTHYLNFEEYKAGWMDAYAFNAE